MLRAVGERAGASSAELAVVSKVGRNTLYALLARLVKDGELQTRALPGGRTGYVLGDTPPAKPANTSISLSTPAVSSMVA